MLNEKSKKEVNLEEMCRSSLRNHKNKTVQKVIAASVNQLVKGVDSQSPISERALLKLKEEAKRNVDQLMERCCYNCLDLDEFLHTRAEVELRMIEVFSEIDKDNAERSQNVNKNLAETLSFESDGLGIGELS